MTPHTDPVEGTHPAVGSLSRTEQASRLEEPSPEAEPWLLDGPRGRRLCLEVLQRIDVSVDAVLVDAMTGGGEAIDPALCSATAGAHLPADLEAGHLLEMALMDSVVWARYWEAPDAVDQLAARADVRAALAPKARAIGAAAWAKTWGAERTAQQWLVHMEEEPGEQPVEEPGDGVSGGSIGRIGGLLQADPAGVLEAWTRELSEAEREGARHGTDPSVSGAWWSIPPQLTVTSDDALIGVLGVEDDLGWTAATTVPLIGSGRTWEIDSPEDWARLCRRFPLDVTVSRGPDWQRATGRASGRWVIPDWLAVAEHVDAVHLTVRGYLRSATRAIPVTEGGEGGASASVIAGWSPGSTLWLRDGLEPSGSTPLSWVLDDSTPSVHWRLR